MKMTTMQYSVFSDDSEDLKDFDDIAFDGKCFVYSDADTFWGGEDSRPYIGMILDSPTWMDLFTESMRQQQATLDFNHCFFEGISVKKISDNPELFQIRLHLGS